MTAADDPVGADPRVRVSISPVYGAVGVAINMMSMLTLITYTLLPLPGQRSIGWWNYVVAAGFFVASLVLAPLAEAREARLQATAGRPR